MIVYNLTRTYLVVLLLLNFILGCKENSQSIKGEKIPQNKSELYDLNFSGVFLKVEVAALPEERELGLMFRDSIGANEGMLFIFKKGTAQRFWMKNTRIPLDIGYFSSSGNLVEVHKAKPFDVTGVPSRSSDIKFVLELNLDAYKKLGIPIGAHLPLGKVSSLIRLRGLDPKQFDLPN